MAAKKARTLTEETAAQMLENIFRACKKAPNTVPLETLRAYSNYRKERFALQRTVIIVMLVLFFLLPLLFISGRFTIETEYTQGNMNPRYCVQPTSWLPVRQISARIEGHTQPVYEGENGTYFIQPTQTGRMEISLTLVNLQTTTHTVDVDRVDYTLPRLIQNRKAGESILLYFADDESGINGAGVSVETMDGQSLSYQFDTENDCLIIPYAGKPLNIAVPDLCGNVLQITLTVQ